jgi:UrcA family protein
MKTILAMICAAALALPLSAAFAETQDEPASVTVSYADLDLSDPAARAVLSRRIDAAVRQVCPGARGRTDLTWSAQRSACRAVARASADRQLAAIYGGGLLAQNAVRVSAVQN